MTFEQMLTCGIIGIVVSWLAIWLVRRNCLLRAGSPAVRHFHHTHETPVPRLGGVALAVAFVAVAVAACALLRFDPLRNNANLTLVLNHNVSPEGGDVAGDTSTHANAASETRRFSNLFTGTDADIVTELSAVARTVGKGRAGQSSQE